MGRKNYYILLAVIAVLGLTSGCLKEPEEPPSALKNSGYMGCSGATVADDSVSVRVDVVMPDKATEVQILRNSTVVGSVFPSDAAMTFIDSNLPALGEVYRYACKAIVSNEGVLGYNQPTVQTNAIESPTFLGLDSVTIQNKVEAKLQWKVPDIKGPKAAKYKIYANLETGGHVDLTATPIATVTAPATSYTIATGNLGDNLNYAFAVLACTANDLCSGGTVYKNATTLDNGAPLTTGASAWKGVAGGLQFTIPWTHKMGEIAKRYIYVNKTTNTTGGLDWANQYQQLKVISTTSLIYNPSLWTTFTDVKIIDSRIIEKSTQHFIIRDVDTQGNQANLFYLKIDNTGDLSAPVFAGYSAVVVNPGDEDTQVKLTFMSIDREGTADPGQATGAAYYKVYYTSEPYVSVSTPNPNDPCKFGTAYNQQFTAINYPPNIVSNIVIPNLTPRTMYRFCLKAVDTAGNESADQAASDLLTVTTWDKTAPQFDGIQSISGVSVDEEYKIKLEYNPATDLNSNVSYYKVRAWITAGGPTAPGTYAAAIRSATVNRFVADGWVDYAYLVNNTDLKYDDLPTDTSAAGKYVRVVIDACDDAHTIPGMSADNCTSLADSTAMSIQPPDIVPPQLFLGIDATWFGTLPTAASTVNGQVIVKFRKPSLFDSHVTADEINQYQDYVGFKVYSVDSSNVPTLIKTCPCATPGACNSTTDLQCTVDNLKPDKVYKLYARAYDAAGNVTKYVDPATKNGSQRVFDGVAPAFAAGVAVTWNNAQSRAELTWNAATDNQDSASVITYQVFRKKTSWTTGEKANPDSVSGALRGTSTTTSYYDTDKVSDAAGDKLASGGNFYYLVCAKDAQNNRTCDNIDKNLFLADVVAPILSGLTTDKTNDTLNTYKKWYIKFLVDENESTFARMSLTVRSKYSASSPSTATASDILDTNGNNSSNITFTSTDSGVNKKGYIQINNLIGTAGAAGYMNYYIEVADENGNKSSLTLSVQFDNTLTFTSIANTSGSTGGGNLLVIKGSGFSNASNNNAGGSTTVKIGTNNCGTLTILSSTIITCIAPASGSGGDVVVTVTNPDGTARTTSNAATTYRYTDGVTYPHVSACDTAPANAYTTQFSGGSGIVSDPYIICNASQIQLLNDPAYVGAGLSFKIMDNLNLSSLTNFTPIGSTTAFVGSLDGAGHLLYNLTVTSANSGSTCSSGLFSVVATNFVAKDLVLYNFTISFNVPNPTSYGSFTYPDYCITNGTSTAAALVGKTSTSPASNAISITGVSVINSTISTNMIDGFYAGGVFGVIDSKANATSNSINNISVEGLTITNTGPTPTAFEISGANNSVAFNEASGGVGAYYKSSTLDSITDIKVSGLTLNCSKQCGGGIGYADKLNMSNWSVLSTNINAKASGKYNAQSYRGSTYVGGLVGRIYSNIASGTNLTFNGTITRVNPGDTAADQTGPLSSVQAFFNYQAMSDKYYGGVFGSLRVTGNDATFSNINVNGTITSDRVSASYPKKPLLDVGGVFGRLVGSRGTGAATNVTVNFNDITVSSLTASCQQGCGGIGGNVDSYGFDPFGSDTYKLNVNFLRNQVNSFTVNDLATYTLSSSLYMFDENGWNRTESGSPAVRKGVGGFIGYISAISAAGGAGSCTSSPCPLLTYYSALSPKVTIQQSLTNTNATNFAKDLGPSGGVVGNIYLFQNDHSTLFFGQTNPQVLVLNDLFVSTNLLNLGVAATSSGGVIGAATYMANASSDSANISVQAEFANLYYSAVSSSKYTTMAVKVSSNRVLVVGKSIGAVAGVASSSTNLDPSSVVCDVAVNNNSFVDSTTNAASSYYPSGATCDGFTSLATAALQDQANSAYTGWDFTSVWKWPTSGTGYPVLRWTGQ